MDLVYILLVIGCCGTTWLLLRLCQTLGGSR